MPSSARSYILYLTEEGDFTSHWRNRKGPVAEGCVVDDSGDIYAPRPSAIVRARSVEQAYWMAHNSALSSARSDELGVWWELREHHQEPPPLGADTRWGWALISWCRSPTGSWWEHCEDAQATKEEIDRFGCGGGCCRRHEIQPMRADEFLWSSEKNRRWINLGGP